MRWFIVLVAGVSSVPVWAHDADVIYVESALTDGAVHERVTMTPDSLLRLAPIDSNGDRSISPQELEAGAAAIGAGMWSEMPLTSGGEACPVGRGIHTLREGYVEFVNEWACGPGELSQDFRFLSILPANYRVVLSAQVGPDVLKLYAQGALTRIAIPRPAVAGPRSDASPLVVIGAWAGVMVLALGGLWLRRQKRA